MKCANCGHGLVGEYHKYTGFGINNKVCLAIIGDGISGFDCGCTNPEPMKEEKIICGQC